jgi:hypothetical protein
MPDNKDQTIKSKENFKIRNSLFDLPAIASRSGEAGGHSIFKTPLN